MPLVFSVIGVALDTLTRQVEESKRELALSPPERAHLAQVYATAMLTTAAAMAGALAWFSCYSLGLFAFTATYPTAAFATCLLVVASVQTGTSLRSMMHAWMLEGFVWGPLLTSVVCLHPAILALALSLVVLAFLTLSNGEREGRDCDHSIRVFTPAYAMIALVYCYYFEVGTFVGWTSLYFVLVLLLLHAYKLGHSIVPSADPVADARALMNNTMRAMRVFVGAPTEGAGEFGRAVEVAAKKKDV